MQDQLGFLQRHGISAGSIDSAQSRDDANDVMARARSGELKILMVSVERLKNERFRNFLQSVPISLLVVDEAHGIGVAGAGRGAVNAAGLAGADHVLINPNQYSNLNNNLNNNAKFYH
jgi:hypothetical protein